MVIKKFKTNKFLNIIIASVWFINGFICKILNLVPRHQQIVAEILGDSNSRLLTIAIGVSELLMAAWILSGYKSKLNAILQIIIIAMMNILEFILVPDLLLWGRFNIAFAILFMVLIYYTNFKHRTTYATIS